MQTSGNTIRGWLVFVAWLGLVVLWVVLFNLVPREHKRTFLMGTVVLFGSGGICRRYLRRWLEDGPEWLSTLDAATVTSLAEDVGSRPPVTQGVIVNSVPQAGPGPTPGLCRWDIITAIDGKPVKNVQDFLTRTDALPADRPCTLSVIRRNLRASGAAPWEQLSMLATWTSCRREHSPSLGRTTWSPRRLWKRASMTRPVMGVADDFALQAICLSCINAISFPTCPQIRLAEDVPAITATRTFVA